MSYRAKPKRKTLCVVMPVYRGVSTTWLKNWFTMDQTPVMCPPLLSDGTMITEAMDQLVKDALALSSWDRLVVMEDDMLPPKDAFLRAASHAPDQEIVGSLYFTRRPPHYCTVYEHADLTECRTLHPNTVKYWADNPGIYQCAATGFGFTSIARHVLENWDHPSIAMFDSDRVHFGSHDIHFCYYARQQGFKVFADSGITCGHLTEIPITYGFHEAAVARGNMPVWISTKPNIV